MAPSKPPTTSKSRLKIDVEIFQKFDASWDRFLRGFGRIVGSKMEPYWHSRCILFQKHRKQKMLIKTNGFSMILDVRRVQVRSKNRTKVDQKARSTWESILASIFYRFKWILGRWGRKSTKNRSQKTLEKRWKKGRYQDGRKLRTGGSNASRNQVSRALGRR